LFGYGTRVQVPLARRRMSGLWWPAVPGGWVPEAPTAQAPPLNEAMALIKPCLGRALLVAWVQLRHVLARNDDRARTLIFGRGRRRGGADQRHAAGGYGDGAENPCPAGGAEGTRAPGCLTAAVLMTTVLADDRPLAVTELHFSPAAWVARLLQSQSQSTRTVSAFVRCLG